MSQDKSDWSVSAQAADLHHQALVWDNHGCLPIRADDSFLPQLQRYADSGVDMVHINIGYGDMSLETHIRTIAFMRRWIMAHPEQYQLVLRIEDIHEAKEQGRLAVAFDIEGGKALEDQPSLLQLFYDLGVRWMLLAYNKTNQLAGGCDDTDTGLTQRGREFIDEMARVGMILCCSHTGHKTVREICDYSSKPVIFSHSNPLAMADHVRNVPDELIQACVDTGGVIGISGIGAFLGDHKAKTETFIRHIDYVVQLVGPQHVGIGLDYVFDFSEMQKAFSKNPGLFPGYSGGTALLVSPEQLPKVTEEMIRLGYSEADILAILGGNFLRVAQQVWQ